MRVNATPPVARVDAIAEGRGPASTSVAPPAAAPVDAHADKVSVEEPADKKALAAAVRRQVGDIRADRLAELEAAVRNGTYKPDPRLIADRILQAAALDATLAANLK